MSQTPVLGVEITGWGSALPRESVSNDELIERYGPETTNEDIIRLTGIESRHIAADDETVVTMAVEAGRKALVRAGIEPPAHIDNLFLGSSTAATYRMVSGAHPGIHRELGADGYTIGASDETNTACTSFMNALLNGYRYFAVDGINRALVLGADRLSTITDYSDRGTGILFADGAGGVVMERKEGDSGLLGWYQETDGSQEEILYCNPADTIKMEGRKVFEEAIKLVTKSGEIALDRAKTEPDEIALMVPHQANIRIISAAAKKIGIDMGRVAVSIGHHGNTSSASIPLALDETLKERPLERGQKLMMVGFGGGMTSGAAVIRW